ncbi:GNAT family N-acetyltransferase [Paraconexibacter sp.]|uniref:GNAT family N-acetyltransferase n=1 Tax=Paraconexibacter sp. TaxID=2949640 RepID=UPI003568A2B5
MSQTLTPFAGAYAICRLPARDPLPPEPLGTARGGLWSVTRTVEELSIVCRAREAPSGATVDGPWCVLKLEGPFALTGETGVIASVLAPLAEAQISVFAMATFDTDYVLVPAPRTGQARAALTRAGHAVTTAPTTLRPGTVDDAPAVASLVTDALDGYRATFAGSAWTATEMESPEVIAERYATPGFRQLVAVEGDGTVVGVVAMRPTDEADQGHVWQVFADSAHAGTGLASRLHEGLLEVAAAEGLRRLRLYCADGASAAAAFYARHGWTRDESGATEDPGGLPVTLLRLRL